MAVAAAPAAEPGAVWEADSVAAGAATRAGLTAVAPTATAAALLGRIGATVVAQVKEPNEPGDE